VWRAFSDCLWLCARVQRMLSGRVPAAQATADPVRPKEASTWAEGLFLCDFTRPIGATRMVARSD